MLEGMEGEASDSALSFGMQASMESTAVPLKSQLGRNRGGKLNGTDELADVVKRYRPSEVLTKWSKLRPGFR